MSKTSQQWYVYMLRCADNSLYTGITTDITRREKEHNGVGAAKYTRARQPVKMIYHEQADDRSSASKREAALKKLTKKQKELLVKADKIEEDTCL